MKLRQLLLVIVLFLGFTACKVTYSFTGLTETPETFQVNFFQNNASLVEPGLDISLEDVVDETPLTNFVEDEDKLREVPPALRGMVKSYLAASPAQKKVLEEILPDIKAFVEQYTKALSIESRKPTDVSARLPVG